METSVHSYLEDLKRDITVPELAEYLRSRRANLAQRVREGADGLASAGLYSDLVDAILQRMLELACRTVAPTMSANRVPLAIVATGGYGRRELCPYSDIDLTFIPHRDADPLVDRIVREMFSAVMSVFIDSNRLEVGYAYRLFEDCGSLDHQTICGLLDARLVAGSERLFIKFENDFWGAFNQAEFVFAKLAERRAQIAAAGGTPWLVEPNVKTGAGGMRDLQTAIWLIQARDALHSSEVRGERSWEVLARESVVTSQDITDLRAAKAELFRVRNAMHVAADAERDQLVVTRQELVAEYLGYGDTSSSGYPPPVQLLMRDLYVATSSVSRIGRSVAEHVELSPLVLGMGLDSVGRRITPVARLLGPESGSWVMFACALAQQYELTFSPELDSAIVERLASRPSLADLSESTDYFGRILSGAYPIYPILQVMAGLGILEWYLPELGSTMNLIPYDQSHDFTIGQHTLYVIRNLDRLHSTRPEEAVREYAAIYAELRHPEELYLAALMHDAGKADPERPHAESGAELAATVCARLGWSEEASTRVQSVVRHHLLMAETSRLRDLTLDDTIREFVAVVTDLELLKMLYVLCWADTSAVGPGIWSDVKGRYLRDLFHRAESALAGEPLQEPQEMGLSQTRSKLARDLAVENLPAEEVNAHLAGMPAPYILNTSLEEIALHIGFARTARAGTPVVDFHDDRGASYTEITVCAVDDPEPGLLSKIAGVLYACDLTVHAAQVFTRVEETIRIAIDSLTVDFRGRQLTAGKRREVTARIKEVLTGQKSVHDVLVQRRKKPEIQGPVGRLKARNDLSNRFGIIEVTAADPEATLYRVSGALSAVGCSIHSARLSMFRGRSAATFYVTGPDGPPDTETMARLRKLLPTSGGATRTSHR